MLTDVVLTVTGPDRTGIVEDVTQVLLEAHGNVGTSRMARLGGEFAILMLVTLPCGEAAGLERRFKDLAAQGYHVTSTQTHGAGDSARTGWAGYRIELVGADHEGIVHQIARDLAERDINIETMETGTSEAAVSGATLFNMNAVVMVPPEVDTAEWLSDLSASADEANVDVTVTALD